MKTFNILLILLVVSTFIHAQNFQISFSGSGASSTVDSVKVENLSKCTSINLSGSDILNLVGTSGIDELGLEHGDKIQVYPNPMNDYCIIKFETSKKERVSIRLIDLKGKIIGQIQELLINGNHTYKISGLCPGQYSLKAESETFCYHTKIVCLNATNRNIEIRKIGTNPAAIQQNKIIPDESAKNIESEKSIVVMQYTNGDRLLLTGESGNFRTVVTLVPTYSQTVNFIFVTCSDANGNHYSVVKIGNQWWMAENLNSGTYATITTPQASGTKFCMNVNGQADPTCPMGGLYEFANLLQGATPCNGSGAPPNDKCSTPIKGLCPNGWHIPSHYEWTTLERNSGSNPSAFPYDMSTTSLLGTDEGGNLKKTCTTYWWAPNTGATNSTGFSGLPGGDTWNGVFEDFGQSAYFWTSTEPFFFAWVHALNYSLTSIGRSSYAVESGFSVRCVKD